ncbi:MAG TPA: hypothetical protein VK629_08345 [Steroidobacteraceae bacterium]|nr:hypothetical protein [Steroidobacteraceae bacterium]
MKALIEWAQEYRGNVRPMDDDEPRFDDLLLEKAAAEDLLEACGDDDQATPT